MHGFKCQCDYIFIIDRDEDKVYGPIYESKATRRTEFMTIEEFATRYSDCYRGAQGFPGLLTPEFVVRGGDIRF